MTPAPPVRDHLCDFCGVPQEHEDLFDKGGYPVLRCRRCGLVACMPPAPAAIAALYSKDYFEGGRGDGYASYGDSGAILSKEFGRLAELIHRQVPGGGKLLEIGAAYGYFLSAAKRYFDVEGIERSEYAAAQSEARGLRVRHGDLLDLPLASQTYEVVVLLDCIEHLPSPQRALARIYALLKPGGLLVLTTGDIDSWAARVMKRNWRLMTPPQHLFFFSRRTLSALLERVGFAGIRFEYPWKWVPLNLILYQVLSRAGVRFSSRPFFNRLGIPVNLFDAMRVMARKPLEPEGLQHA